MRRIDIANKEDTVFASDFLVNMNVHPNTGDLLLRTNADSIKRNIRNIIFTDKDERFFSDLGSDLSSFIFELGSSVLEDDVKEALTYAINTYEPRAVVEDIKVKTNNQQITLDVYFYTINNSELNHLQVSVDRIR